MYLRTQPIALKKIQEIKDIQERKEIQEVQDFEDDQEIKEINDFDELSKTSASNGCLRL